MEAVAGSEPHRRSERVSPKLEQTYAAIALAEEFFTSGIWDQKRLEEVMSKPLSAEMKSRLALQKQSVERVLESYKFRKFMTGMYGGVSSLGFFSMFAGTGAVGGMFGGLFAWEAVVQVHHAELAEDELKRRGEDIPD